MTTSNTVTKTDLTNILNEVLPIRSNTPLTEITLPYTPQANGILFGQLRASSAGRAYKHFYNATPELWDFYQSAGGYQTFASFVVAGQQISERAISNIQQQFYYYMPLDGYGIAGKGIDYIVEQGTSGIWTYEKWSDKTYHAWYEGPINLGAGTAMGGGYFHTSSSALTPPTFSASVTSMVGGSNGAYLYAYVGHSPSYETYWWNGGSASATNLAVRLDMYGTWS